LQQYILFSFYNIRTKVNKGNHRAWNVALTVFSYKEPPKRHPVEHRAGTVKTGCGTRSIYATEEIGSIKDVTKYFKLMKYLISAIICWINVQPCTIIKMVHIVS
jgi:hypothetical protein